MLGLFMWVPGNWNSGLPAIVKNTLPTKPCPQPQQHNRSSECRLREGKGRASLVQARNWSAGTAFWWGLPISPLPLLRGSTFSHSSAEEEQTPQLSPQFPALLSLAPSPLWLGRVRRGELRIWPCDAWIPETPALRINVTEVSNGCATVSLYSVACSLFRNRLTVSSAKWIYPTYSSSRG